MSFSGLSGLSNTTGGPIEISEMSALSFVAPNAGSILTMGQTSGFGDNFTAAIPASIVSGSSGGVTLIPLTFFDDTSTTIDTATDGGAGNDQITINGDLSNSGTPADGQAQGLKNLTVTTGGGNDNLTVNANVYSLPVAGGTFLYIAGTGPTSSITANVNLTQQIVSQLTLSQSSGVGTLTSSAGGSITLDNLAGKVANLNDVAGTGGNNFTLQNWTGTVNVDDMANSTDTLNLTMTGGTVNALSNLILLSPVTTNPAAVAAVVNGPGILNVSTGNPIVFNVGLGTSAYDLIVNAVLAGANGLQKTGAGTMKVTNTETYTGTTSVIAGTLLVDGSLAAGSPVVVGDGVHANSGTLGGTGTVFGSLTANLGGTVSPGDPATPGVAVFTVGGNLTFNAGSTYFININPDVTMGVEPIAGTDYDQLNVFGTIAINSATLSGTSSAVPAIGSDITIILNHNGAPAVTGNPNPNFGNGYAPNFVPAFEGGFIIVGGVTYNITYAGNNHNDVVLTSIGRFDFGTATSPVDTADGYSQVTNNTLIAHGSFGWVTAPNAVDRGTPTGTNYDKMLEDLNFDNTADDFQVDVLQPGTYSVTVTMGDATTLHDNMQIAFPGATVVTQDPMTLTSAAGQFDTATYYVTLPVGDTVLDLRLSKPSSGNIDPNWVINGLTILPDFSQNVSHTSVAPLMLQRTASSDGTAASGFVTPNPNVPGSFGGTVLADGFSVDTYTGTGAAPLAFITVSSTLNGKPFGTIITADADPYTAGVQVQANSSGVFTFQILRPTGTGPGVVEVYERTGLEYGVAFQPYTLPNTRNLEFNPAAVSPATIAASTVPGATESGTTVTITTTVANGFTVGETIVIAGVPVAGYNGTFTIVSVPTATSFTYTDHATLLANSGGGIASGTSYLAVSHVVYSSQAANALGWEGTAPLSTSYATPANNVLLQGFDYNIGSDIYEINLPSVNGSTAYEITATMGDSQKLHDDDDIRVSVNGGSFASVLNGNLVGNAAGQFTVTNFDVTSTTTITSVQVEFIDLGGVDPDFVVNALQIRPVATVQNIAIALTSSGSNPANDPGDLNTAANGMSVDTYTGTILGATNLAGHSITLTTTLGTIVGVDNGTGGFVTDGNSLITGLQAIVEANNTFKFEVMRPTLAGTAPVFTATEITGAATGTLTGAIYTVPEVRQYAFIPAGAAYTSPILPVLPTAVYATQGFGWTTTPLALTRGGGAGTTENSFQYDNVTDSFQVQVNPGTQYTVRIYIFDSASAHDAEVTVGASSMSVASAAGKLQDPVFTVTSSGVLGGPPVTLSVTLSVVGSVNPDWVLNGLDIVQTVGGTPPPLQPELATSVIADSKEPSLTQTELAPIAAAAIQRLAATGLSAAQVAELKAITYVIQPNLAATTGALGLTVLNSEVVTLDATGAGHGWFIDPTPTNDDSFRNQVSASELLATNPAAATGYDLLTVIMHEDEHVLGVSDVSAAVAPNVLMTNTLSVGMRRLPAGEAPQYVDASAILSSSDIAALNQVQSSKSEVPLFTVSPATTAAFVSSDTVVATAVFNNGRQTAILGSGVAKPLSSQDTIDLLASDRGNDPLK